MVVILATTVTSPGNVLRLLLCAFALSACSSLPTFVPDLQRSHGTPIRLEGTRGPLSAVQSKVILDRLRARSPDTDIFDRHLALEEAINGKPLTTGNQVVLLQDGPDTYRSMLAAISAARDHINMETYILDDDETGQRFAQALIDKQNMGIQVNLIYDSAGTFGTPAAFFKRLADAGVRVLEYNPINPLLARKEWELNQRDHRKLLIVDGSTAFLGGINISSVYSGGSFGQKAKARVSSAGASSDKLAWRDTDLRLQGPVVAEFQKLFLETWEAQKGEQLETSVNITNAYFVPDPQMLAALAAAARRGVDVKLILPSQTDSWLVLNAGHHYYESLLRAGVKIFHRRGVILHSKTALIDGVWATVGSTNMDWRSFLHNRELNAVVLGAEFGSQLQAMFNKDLLASDAVTLEQWQQRPFEKRAKELFARMWEYWL